MKTKLRKAAGQLRYLPRALTLVWAAARRWTMAWVALLPVQGLLPLVTVCLTRTLVDSVAGAVRAHQTDLLQDHIASLVHGKSIEVDLSFYDSPDFFRCLRRARTSASA